MAILFSTRPARGAGRRPSFYVLFILFSFLPGTTCAHANKKMPPHRIFDKEHYEIKSCLSPDLQHHEKATCRFYALMLDAGSTGSRIHIFEFSHDTKNPAAPFKLEREEFMEVKPGLSDFAAKPDQAADSIKPLVAKAESIVPKNLWSHTPLALKATAGLRLLPAETAEAILDEVEDMLATSPFLVNEDSVAVMSGTDEGIFGWFTLNFLLDRLDSLIQKPEGLTDAVRKRLTTVALDLGGGSTQVTFRPRSDETLSNSPSGYLKEIRVFNQTVPVYTHSYLGNGLMAARMNILRMSNKPSDIQRLNLKTACFPPAYSVRWNYSFAWYSISGINYYSYDRCRAEVLKFIVDKGIDKPLEIASRDVYAFGYYFDRAQQAGLVAHDTKGGHVKVSDLESAAKTACKRTTFGAHHWEPWQCMDLTYIHALLSDGYALPTEKSLFFAKKFRNMEVSWALGAAYHLLNTYHESGSLQHSAGFRDYHGHRLFGSYSELFVNAGHYLCSRMYYGLSTIMSYFQLLA